MLAKGLDITFFEETSTFEERATAVIDSRKNLSEAVQELKDAMPADNSKLGLTSEDGSNVSAQTEDGTDSPDEAKVKESVTDLNGDTATFQEVKNVLVQFNGVNGESIKTIDDITAAVNGVKEIVVGNKKDQVVKDKLSEILGKISTVKEGSSADSIALAENHSSTAVIKSDVINVLKDLEKINTIHIVGFP